MWLGLILRHSLDQLSFDVRDCLLTPGLEFIVGLRSEQRALHTVILGNHFRVRPLCKTKCNINKITNCDYTLAIDTIVLKPFEMLGD